MVNKTLIVTVAAAVFGFGQLSHAQDKIDFAKQIRPIIADSCYKCHGEKKIKGKLRLDSAAAFEKGGKDGKVIEAGHPDKSDLYRRITLSKDDDDVMPPEGDLLPKAKQDLIKDWIAQGASFGTWKSDAGAKVAEAGNEAPAPTEEKLPTVAAADPATMSKIRQTGALAMPLAQNTNLVEIDYNLVGDHTADAQLADLAAISTQVETLNLARTHITDDGLKAVEPLKNLRKLHLENTKIGDAGLTHLKGLTSLEYLNLYGTQVTDSGLEQLEGLKNLKALYLWQTKVTPSGVEKLQKALPKCQINTGWENTKEAAK